MDQIELQVAPREVLGKKVRFLRRQGLIPANIFGSRKASTAVQIELKPLQKALRKAGSNTLISLKIDREQPKMVLVRGAQKDPRTGRLLHVDFYEVAMTEKLKAEIPVHAVGESPAVKDQDGILLHLLDTIEVECLPGDLPHAIEVDISSLTEIDSAIYVRDLSIPPRVEVLTDAAEIVLKINAVRGEAEEVVAAEEVAEAPTAGAGDTTAEAESS